MRLGTLVDAIKAANLNALILTLRDRGAAREYLSQGQQRFDELMGRGLRRRNPVAFVCTQGWGQRSNEQRVQLPATLDASGGTRLDELLVLATVTAVLRPRTVFEIGTFNGRTTSAFALNAPPDAVVTSLDLPPDDGDGAVSGYLPTDLELVRQRRVGSVLHDLQLADRYHQLLCDSREFDPTPYAGSIELGFIDGAHTLEYVENDTRKMAAMAAERGLVFWHDYGGKGRFRALTEYLDRLSRAIAVYRIAGTTLAWSPAPELRKLAHR
jgi:hypothetical protein